MVIHHDSLSMFQVDKIFSAMDISSAGEVEYNEFLGAALPDPPPKNSPPPHTPLTWGDRASTGAALSSQKATVTNPSLLAAFHLFDRDHDG